MSREFTEENNLVPSESKHAEEGSLKKRKGYYVIQEPGQGEEISSGKSEVAICVER
jgi:hypothetical protein